jgi:rhodanese-related sulfurtransferase
MVRTLTPAQVSELLATTEVDVVDVRESSEWATGHVPGARLVPLAELQAHPEAHLKDKTSPVLFVCAAGVRSQTAARLAASLGVSQVFNLSGGTRAWVKAGQLLETPASVQGAPELALAV